MEATATPVDRATAGPGHDHYLVQGHEITLPLHVAHARVAMALFSADAEAVADDLPDGLAPVETLPGRALVALAAVAYVDNPLGDYDEGVVASVVRPTSDPGAVASIRDVLAGRHGVFVHHMPVSQAFTREAGDRIWGFPKTLDQLDHRLSDRRAGLRWATGDGEIFELTMPRGAGLPVPPQAAAAYAFRDGTVWRTRLGMTGHGLGMSLGGRLRLGTHPIADQLRRWGLTRRARASAWIDHATMDFDAAEPLAARGA